ncbi:hypothetical protein WDW86_16215 [Bdellovibrionota bacterium FG-2]
MKILLPIIFLAFLGVAFPMASQGTGISPLPLRRSPPDQDWLTFSTSHFHVLTHPKSRVFSEDFADFLEEAFSVLREELRWAPQGQIEVVVRADRDVSEDESSVFPFNRIVVQAVLPNPATAEGEAQNWVRALAYHELTHVVEKDLVHGLISLFHFGMGSVAKVNRFLPPFLLEGLAVVEEGRHGSLGRGQSVFYETVYRGAVGSGTLGTIGVDGLNGEDPRWPAQNAPYYYGSLLQSYLDRDPSSVGLAYASGRRAPLFLDSLARDLFSKDWETLWKEAREDAQERFSKQLSEIRSRPISEVRFLSQSGGMSRAAAWASTAKGEQQLAYIRDSVETGAGISVVGLDSSRNVDQTFWKYGGGQTLKRCDGKLVFSRIEPWQQYSYFSDLFSWDSRTGSETQLSFGVRALDPDCSEDFKWGARADAPGVARGEWVYVQNLPDANQALVVWDGKSKPRNLLQGHAYERYSTPAWGRGDFSEWIAVTLKENEFSERLILVHSKTAEIRPLFSRVPSSLRRPFVTPSWRTSGDLLFSVADDGVFDVAQVSSARLKEFLATGKPIPYQRLTHLESGSLFPLQGPDASFSDLYATVYRSSGFDVARVSKVKSEAREAQAQVEISHPSPSIVPKTEKYQVRPMVVDSFFPALLPHYWVPYGERLSEGWSLGVLTSGMDALEQVTYSLQAGWDSRANFPLYRFEFGYEGSYPSLLFSRAQEDRYLGYLNLANRFIGNHVLANFPLGLFEVGFGGNWNESHFFNEKAESGGLEFRFSVGEFRGFPNSPAPVYGGSGVRGFKGAVKLEGVFVGDEQFTALEGSWDQRLQGWGSQDFFRARLLGARSTNTILSAHYWIAGGDGTFSQGEGFLLRGYPQGVVFGRELASANFEYTFVVKDVFRGLGVWPFFYERAKMQLFVDTGSGEYFSSGEERFSRWPVSTGVHLFQDLNLFFRSHWTVGIGFDWGLSSTLLGEKQFVFGFVGNLG